MAPSLKRRVIRAGSWHVIKRAIKLVPVVGSIFAVGLVGYEIKKKGLIPGVAHVGLDVIPVVGATKNVVEIFTGDLIPDKDTLPKAANDQPDAGTDHVPLVPRKRTID